MQYIRYWQVLWTRIKREFRENYLKNKCIWNPKQQYQSLNSLGTHWAWECVQKFDREVPSGKSPVRKWGPQDWAQEKLNRVVAYEPSVSLQLRGLFTVVHVEAKGPGLCIPWISPWPRGMPSKRHFLESWVSFLESGYCLSSLSCRVIGWCQRINCLRLCSLSLQARIIFLPNIRIKMIKWW